MQKELFRTFNTYVRETFGEKVWKVPVDAGFTCPNRDGFKGEGGCVYCNVDAFTHCEPGDIRRQVLERIERLQKRNINKFIVYFQSYSNTYAPYDLFVSRIEESLCHEGIAAVFVGTRPDVVDEQKLGYLASLKDRYEVVLEYGLQSKHDATLYVINRGHTLDDFQQGYDLAKSAGLAVCVHVIFGLPGETPEMMLDTVRYLADLDVDMVKFHHLHIVTGTPLEKMYHRGELSLLSEDDYIAVLGEAIALLPEKTVVARLKGDTDDRYLVAPKWTSTKQEFTAKLEAYMRQNGLSQGAKRR